MKKRDKFALKAMEVIMQVEHIRNSSELARRAYVLADAMIRERQKQ
jgi:hypothetical protein